MYNAQLLQDDCIIPLMRLSGAINNCPGTAGMNWDCPHTAGHMTNWLLVILFPFVVFYLECSFVGLLWHFGDINPEHKII